MSELIQGFLALLELVFHGIVFSISRAVTLVAWLCSKRFRDRKRVEWKDHKIRKLAELGLSGICVAGLVAVAAWLLLPDVKPRTSALQIEQPQAGEDLRLKVQVTGHNGQKEAIRVAVKEGGTARILGAESMKDLKQQLEANLQVIVPRPDITTNAGIDRQLKPEEADDDK